MSLDLIKWHRVRLFIKSTDLTTVLVILDTLFVFLSAWYLYIVTMFLVVGQASSLLRILIEKYGVNNTFSALLVIFCVTIVTSIAQSHRFHAWTYLIHTIFTSYLGAELVGITGISISTGIYWILAIIASLGFIRVRAGA